MLPRQGTDDAPEPPVFAEIPEEDTGPPEASVVRRASSFTDVQLAAKRSARARQSREVRATREDRSWEALDVPCTHRVDDLSTLPLLNEGTDELLQESRRDYRYACPSMRRGGPETDKIG